ncbi:YlbF family regulator [Bellilinea sp.]
MDNTTPLDANPALLDEALHNLIEQLTHSESFARLRSAEQNLMNDEQALSLLNRLAEVQQKVKAQQQSGKPSEEDVRRLQQLQVEVAEHPLIQEYEYSREAYIALVRQVNQHISQEIGLDFASLTRRW